jgi:hypothetical protein
LTKADYDEFRDALWESSTKIHLLSSSPLRAEARKLTGITIDFLNEQDEDKRSAILQRRDEEELIKTFLSRAQEEIAIDKLLDQPQQQGQ